MLTCLVVLWLRLHSSTAGSTGLIPGRRTKIPHALRYNWKKNVIFAHHFFGVVFVCLIYYIKTLGLPWWLRWIKKSACNLGDLGSIPGLGRIPTPVFLPGESPWTEEPRCYSSWGHKELDMISWCPCKFCAQGEWSWTSQPPKLWETDIYYCSRSPYEIFCCSSPNWLRQLLAEGEGRCEVTQLFLWGEGSKSHQKSIVALSGPWMPIWCCWWRI